MSGLTPRKNAITEITNRAPKECKMPGPLSQIWATDVFGLAAMEEALSKNAFKAIKKTVQTGATLDSATACIGRITTIPRPIKAVKWMQNTPEIFA